MTMKSEKEKKKKRKRELIAIALCQANRTLYNSILIYKIPCCVCVSWGDAEQGKAASLI